MSTNIKIDQIREQLKKFELEKLFTESLGWNHPQDSNEKSVSVMEKTFQYSHLAEIGGAKVLKFKSENLKEIDKEERKKFIKK